MACACELTGRQRFSWPFRLLTALGLGGENPLKFSSVIPFHSNISFFFFFILSKSKDAKELYNI